MDHHQSWSESSNHHGGTVMEQQRLHQTTSVVHDATAQQHHDYATHQYDPSTANTTDGLLHAAAAMDYAALYGTSVTHNNNNNSATAPAEDTTAMNGTGGDSPPKYHSLHQQQQQQQQQPETTSNPQYALDPANRTTTTADEQQQQQSNPPPPATTTTTAPTRKQPKLCKFPGCTRIAKSGGHCQAHGAKAKRCSVNGCDKQAQTTHEGMCKRHWKLKNFPDNEGQQQQQQQHHTTTQNQEAPSPNADSHFKSVYETVLPQSIAFRPMAAAKAKEAQDTASTSSSHQQQHYEPPPPKVTGANYDPLDPPPAPEGATVMPLVSFFQEGASKPFGWHRNEERQARGLKPITNNFGMQLEEWERQLAVVETLLLGGGTPYANFQNLAHGWGRKKGFHSALINTVCENRRDIIRKRRNEFADAQLQQQQQQSAEEEDDDDEEEIGENDAKRQALGE